MKTNTVPETPEKTNGRSLLIIAGVLLGMSFAGFFDGIVLHQILQWHHMVSSIRPTDSIEDLEANTFWDGVFLVGASILTALGLSLLWVAHKRDSLSHSTKTLVASLLFGMGAFNVVEGLIDHHLLGIHHVKSGSNQLFWDLGFLAFSSVLAGVGLLLLRSASSLPSQNSETQT
ncbi:MAG: DUF2243 domain-containing protein [Hydrococcus sp. RU_2_2]|nr:DUF2243 domain-containing protein [Hydrococcus sp. RU_2_2]NJP18635.1 DUF2243 domain-containing protein [Hydrococcus sp. CRU_1_1]